MYTPKNNKIFTKLSPLSMEQYYKSNMVGAPVAFGRVGSKPPKEHKDIRQGVGKYFEFKGGIKEDLNKNVEKNKCDISYFEFTENYFNMKLNAYYPEWKQKNGKVYDIIFEILELNPQNIKELMESV